MKISKAKRHAWIQWLDEVIERKARRRKFEIAVMNEMIRNYNKALESGKLPKTQKEAMQHLEDRLKRLGQELIREVFGEPRYPGEPFVRIQKMEHVNIKIQ